MNRIYNFSPGPATLPLEVLQEVQAEFLDLQFNGKGLGMSIVEVSHRSKAYDEIHFNAEKEFKELLGLGDDYRVLFLQSGASNQFSMVPLNFLPEGRVADYIITGSWAEKACAEAGRLGKVNIAATGKDNHFTQLPTQFTLSDNPAYVHLTSNNTIYGTQWRDFTKLGLQPEKNILVADMSSDILSYPFKADDFGIIYAGAQKNLGPAGLTVVIIRKELAEKSPAHLPVLMKYDTFAKNDSLYNTPPVFNIYVMYRVLGWIKRQGGLSAMAEHNAAKAKLIYDVIDKHPDFYLGHAHKDARSYMNITFRVPDEDLEKKFVAASEAAGLSNLKGHRLVGGLRASIYNAMTMEGCRALAKFMTDFVAKA